MKTHFFLMVVQPVVFVCGLCVSGAEIPYKDFKQRVTEGIGSESLTLVTPLFREPRAQAESPVLQYSLGGRLNLVESAPSKPLDYPVNLQCTVEGLRKCGSARFLQPDLSRAEAVVAEELSLIAKTTGSRDDLMKSLSQLDVKARSALDDAVKRYAESKGWKADDTVPFHSDDTVSRHVAEPKSWRPRGGAAKHHAPEPKSWKAATSTPKSGGYSVIVSTDPVPARVYYLSKWEYDTLTLAELASDYRHWTEVGMTGSQSEVTICPISGRYHFRVIWPQLGKDYTSGVYDVRASRKLPFSANAVN